MMIELLLRARDAHDLMTTVSATLDVDVASAASSDSVIEEIAGHVRVAAEHLRTAVITERTDTAPARTTGFIPLATYVTSRRSDPSCVRGR